MAHPAPTDAETLKHLQEQIQQLATSIEALALKQEEYFSKAQETSDTEEDNTSDENDLTIEQGSNFELPEFHGRQSPEEFLDWIVIVEDTIELKRISLNRCVPIIAMQFRGSAASWWTQVNASRARFGKPSILSWDKLKKKMRKRFVPLHYGQELYQRLHKLQQGKRSVEEYWTEFFWLLRRVELEDSNQQIAARFIGGLRQQKMKETLELFNPPTLAKAHEMALIMETQLKANIWHKRAEDATLCWCLTGMGLTTTFLGLVLVARVVFTIRTLRKG